MTAPGPGAITVPPDTLAEQARLVLRAWGMREGDIGKTAEAMLYADLSGIDSHGISMLMTYARLRDSGRLALDADRAILTETAAVATMDAGGGLGHPAAHDAMQLAAEKARATGIGAVAVRHSHHFGALGAYVRLASERGLWGIATTSTRLRSVLPTGGRQTRMGTNPLAFAAPAADGDEILLDMSTAVVASNKVRASGLKEVDIPAGWVTDGSGRSITDADGAYEAIQYDEHAGLAPLGGPGTAHGGHKGFGLALMVQLLSCALSGAGQPGDDDIGHFFLALDPAAFAGERVAAEYARELLGTIRGTEPLDPARPVVIPGEPERDERRRRERHGVPLPARLVAALREECARTGAALILEGPS